jgi:lauroyl/myristoyl acyltransferase
MKNPLPTKKNIRRITEFLNSPRGLKYIPYGLANRYISWFCKTSFAQKRFFRKKLPIVEEFLEQFPGRWDNQEVIAGFFALNYLHGWRASAVSHFRKSSFRRRVRVHGLDAFRKSYEKGRGVIVLGSHFGLPAVSFSVFPRLGYRNFYTIIGEKGSDSVKFKGMHEKNKPKTLVFKRGGESGAFGLLFEAKKLLEEGGILHLLGDGAHGRASHNLPLLGKVRGFRATFAELSVLTGAAVFPVFIIPRKGKIIVTIEKPLNTGKEDMERDERVKLAVKEYAAIVEKKWMENPQYINGGFMEMYNHSIMIPDEGLKDN